MWLPRPLYESIPYLWMTTGVLLLGLPFLDNFRYRGTSIVFGVICLVLGLVLWMRRRDYRNLQQQYGKSLDE